MTERDEFQSRARWRTLLGWVAQSSLELYAYLDPDGWMGLLEERPPEPGPFVLFKGSFDPIHHGHVALFATSLRKHAPGAGAYAVSFNTSKGNLALEDLAARSRLIHAAGYPVIVSRSGRFSHAAAAFRRLPAVVRLVFPVGIDTLLRLLAYYPPAEFERLFPDCVFEYYGRQGYPSTLPRQYHGYPRVDRLGENPLPSVSSSRLRRLRAEAMGDEVRALMPPAAAELFLAASTEVDRGALARQQATASSDQDTGGEDDLLIGRPRLEIVRAEGAYLNLRGGRRVLDAAGSAGVVNVGYGRPEVVEAVARAARAVSYAAPGFTTPDRRALVKRLRSDWLPEELSHVHLTSSGSEAIEVAIMLARKYQVASGRLHRWKVVGRDLSYHGATLGSLAIGGHDLRRSGLGDLLSEQPHAAACYCLRCPFGKRYPECQVECGHSLESVIEREGAETIAAFVLEPIVGPSGGALVPPDEYWGTVHEICRRHNIVVIADEVMTGLGRTGRRFAFEHWGPPPDILVIGKGLTGGYAPLSAVAASTAVAECLDAMGMRPVSHTFDGHSPACAAAEAVLGILRRERLPERVADLGPELGGRLIERLAEHRHVADVRGRGFLWAVEVVRDRTTLERFPRHMEVTRRIVRAGLDQGVFFYPGGNGAARDIVVVSPPFVLAEAEMQRIAVVLEAAIDEALQGL